MTAKCKYCQYEAKDWKDLAEHIIGETDEKHDDKKWARNFLAKKQSGGVKKSATASKGGISEAQKMRFATDLLVGKVITLEHPVGKWLVEKLGGE